MQTELYEECNRKMFKLKLVFKAGLDSRADIDS